jgi:methyl-accepting chemotaxis protein
MELTIRSKLLTAFGVVVVLMLFSVCFVSYRLRESSLVQEQVKDVRYPAIMDAAQVGNAAVDTASALRAYVLFGSDPNDATRFKADRQDAWSRLDKALQSMQSRSAALSSEDRDSVNALSSEIASYHTLQDKVEQMAIGGSSEDSGKAYELLKGDVSTQGRDINSKLTSFREATQKQSSDDLASLVSGSRTTQILLWVVTLLACGLAISVAVFFSNQVSSSLRALVERVGNIAAGDLTGDPIPVKEKDEVGVLTESVNGMQERLQEMISQMHGVADSVSGATESIASAAQQQAQGAEAAKDQTTQVATAIQEMFSTVSQVSENSSLAASAAQQAASTAKKGGGIVDETMNKMRSIATGVSETAKKIEALGKASNQIGHIAGVIDDIADQTNLLALNAAIEAARAGEQGRGFAVVADEVRKLAERTASATKEIAEMIRSIQEETMLAVEDMNERNVQVNDGLKSTAQAGDALREIISMAEHVGDMITQIASAASQQTAATEDMSSNVDHIAELSNTTATSAGETAGACVDLSGMASSLQEMVRRFKVNEAAVSYAPAAAARRLTHAPAATAAPKTLMHTHSSSHVN